MRVIVFFDLPVTTNKERKDAGKFRKFLISEGFVMMQESVYSKLLLNASGLKSIENNLKKNKPPSGLIQLLTVTERQYNDMVYILGTAPNSTVNNSERIVII